MADTKTEPNVAVTTDAGGNLVSQLVDPFEIGDCQMNAGAQVTLTLSADGSTVSAHWTCQVFTRHPQPLVGDQWHQTFLYKTRKGTHIVSANFDGPGMDHANQVVDVDQTKDFVIGDSDLFDLIKAVDWTGEC